MCRDVRGATSRPIDNSDDGHSGSLWFKVYCAVIPPLDVTQYTARRQQKRDL